MATLRSILITTLGALWVVPVQAQNELEDVRVESYYVSDANDATDEDGGGLQVGSRTYRIFVDLGAGCSLLALYGDTNHLFSVGSTAVFFNNADRGKTYGHEIADNRLDENTVALDSWLTLGGASNLRYGIEKSADTDGSILGGANNDGGSATIVGGLLVNQDTDAGIPLTVQDGLVPLNGGIVPPPGFYQLGDDPASALDVLSEASDFTSTDLVMGCSNPGVAGQGAENVILIAQLTTTGELRFELNLIISRPDGTPIRFVANDSILLPGEQLFARLNYPPTCGCTDPDYLEFDPNAGCEEPGACVTEIIFGCTDAAACNYDPLANFSVPVLCCYGPNDCNGLNYELVCGEVGVDEETSVDGLRLYPNPAEDLLHIDQVLPTSEPSMIQVIDAAGRCVVRIANTPLQKGPLAIDIQDLPAGTYQLMLIGPSAISTRRFVVLR